MGERFGQGGHRGGAGGLEVDRADASLGTPRHALRVAVGQLTIPADLVRDQSISELWVEVDLSCLGITKGINTRAVAKPATERSADSRNLLSCDARTSTIFRCCSTYAATLPGSGMHATVAGRTAWRRRRR